MRPHEPRVVLYVDDEPDIREIVQMALALEGLEVHLCESGEEALDALPRIRPDLVLLDVMMPRLDGPGTLERMRATSEFASIPVVFVTAKAMPQEIRRFKELGAAAVIAKPFDPMQLARQVLSIWEGL
ncbi:MAG TPA: response regulator [Steroidobacteraceae bacterium]